MTHIVYYEEDEIHSMAFALREFLVTKDWKNTAKKIRPKSRATTIYGKGSSRVFLKLCQAGEMVTRMAFSFDDSCMNPDDLADVYYDSISTYEAEFYKCKVIFTA